MPFSNRGKALIKNVYQFENTVLKGYWWNFWR